jgi:AmmeMemoRadiSam system protein A
MSAPDRSRESPPVALARRTVELYVRTAAIPHPPDPLPPELDVPAATFVSIKTRSGGGMSLRGCIGTLEPTCANAAQEIIENAVKASTQDPRFPPVRPDELDDLVYSVDVLSAPEPVSDLADLDPIRYGVIVRSGKRRGVLLPNLETVDTVEEQLSIAMRKAGISEGEPVEILRFEVVRYT